MNDPLIPACRSLGTAIGSVVNYSLIKGVSASAYDMDEATNAEASVMQVIASKRPYLDGSLLDPTGQWNARKPKIFYSASIIWGLIGPQRCVFLRLHQSLSVLKVD